MEMANSRFAFRESIPERSGFLCSSIGQSGISLADACCQFLSNVGNLLLSVVLPRLIRNTHT